MTTTIWWIRRDLRLSDNVALASAASEGSVVAVYVEDPFFDRYQSTPRGRYLRSALTALASELASQGAALHVLRGRPEVVLPEFASRAGARSVHATREFTPYASSRDVRVAQALGSCTLVLDGSSYAVTPGMLRRDGRPFRVFSAFHRRWTETLTRPSGTVPVTWSGLARPVCEASIMPVDDLTSEESHGSLWLPRWQTFEADSLPEYETARDRPDRDGTSRLSAALRFGLVHPARLITGLGAASPFARQLAWRDFYADLLYASPDWAWKNADTRFDRLAVDTDASAHARFARFTSGVTGYPLVDAGIHELLSTGFVHNRVRMVMASFLIKDLHLPWQWGARFFMKHLLDGDLASNSLSWQWAAGCGVDAAPYYRVLNPVAQGERFDPDGVYVRRFLPALTGMPDRFVHAPWRSPGGVPAGYAPPMVDHAVEREEALRRLRETSR